MILGGNSRNESWIGWRSTSETSRDGESLVIGLTEVKLFEYPVLPIHRVGSGLSVLVILRADVKPQVGHCNSSFRPTA